MATVLEVGRARTGWLGVNAHLLNETVSLICRVYLKVAARASMQANLSLTTQVKEKRKARLIHRPLSVWWQLSSREGQA